MRDDFSELLRRTATETICSYNDLVRLSNFWFIDRERKRDGFDSALRIYTNLRNAGFPHVESINNLGHIVNMMEASEVDKARRNRKIVKEDTRMIRDE